MQNCLPALSMIIGSSSHRVCIKAKKKSDELSRRTRIISIANLPVFIAMDRELEQSALKKCSWIRVVGRFGKRQLDDSESARLRLSSKELGVGRFGKRRITYAFKLSFVPGTRRFPNSPTPNSFELFF